MSSLRIAILGNAGSGKSTLARHLAARHGVPVLDLDTVAWEPDAPAQPRPDAQAIDDVRAFCRQHAQCVVEGCYAHLVDAALAFWPLLVFLNPGTAACLAHCRARPWEPHKYASQAEQDANLPLLLDWVAAYETREGPLSLAAHRRCFDGYAGPKCELTAPARPARAVADAAGTGGLTRRDCGPACARTARKARHQRGTATMRTTARPTSCCR